MNVVVDLKQNKAGTLTFASFKVNRVTAQGPSHEAVIGHRYAFDLTSDGIVPILPTKQTVYMAIKSFNVPTWSFCCQMLGYFPIFLNA
jgi:hypothetical protein